VDITYKWTASILRGIWELAWIYGYYTVNLKICVGAVDEEHLRGYAIVYPGTVAIKSSLESETYMLTDTIF